MANFAIGDLQGCYDSFLCLLEKINFDAHKDQLWLAGDLVNRGPDSLSTLKHVFQLSQQGACSTVLGNHDLHMLAVYHGCSTARPKDNFHDVLEDKDAGVLLNWLQSQYLALDINVNNKQFLLTHAGIPPIWSPQQTLAYASEVEKFLRGDTYSEYFNNMYGNLPDTWHEELSGIERLRTITNYLTRMRFCNKDGQLELLSKTPPGESPPGYQAWFSFENPFIKDTKLLFGHWAALQGQTNSTQHFALDTGCVWGKKLSALRLEDEVWFSCDCHHIAS